MKNINLIPIKYRYKHKFKIFIYKMVAIEATIFLFTILLVINALGTLNAKLDEIANLNVLIEDTRYIESNNIAKLLTIKEKEKQVYEEITKLFQREAGYESSINIVMENILEGMEIIEISYNNQYGQVIVMTQVEDKNLIPLFIDNLNNTNIFNQIYILNANNNIEGTIFTIEMSTNNSRG